MALPDRASTGGRVVSVLFVPVTLRCDGCDQTMTVNRATVAATRSYALKLGWRVAMLGDLRAGVSSDPRKPDLCPDCREAVE